MCKKGMLRTRGKEGGRENKREREREREEGGRGKREIVCTKKLKCVCLCSTYSSWIDNRISIPFIYMVASCPCVYCIGSPETNIMIRLTVSVSTLSRLFTIVHTFFQDTRFIFTQFVHKFQSSLSLL